MFIYCIDVLWVLSSHHETKTKKTIETKETKETTEKKETKKRNETKDQKETNETQKKVCSQKNSFTPQKTFYQKTLSTRKIPHTGDKESLDQCGK